MDNNYRLKVDVAKRTYYKKEIASLTNSDPRKWYHWLKRLVPSGQLKGNEFSVEDINHLSSEEQAEKIADAMSKVRNEYEPLQTNDIKVPFFGENKIPMISVTSVEKVLETLNINKSTPKGDIPTKIIKQFSKYLSAPLALIVNSSIREGTWPDIFKEEIVTPVPKVYPPKSIEDLREISGLLTFDKVAKKVVGKLVIKDMKAKLDPSQYANQKQIGIQHYLVKMLNRILVALDSNSKGEVKAALATFVDWKQAFPRQCPKLGVDAFVACGVRPALIPMLLNYFQNCRLRVKWKGIYSNIRKLNGGGPQGSLFGILEYLAQSNDNADMVSPEDRYKFVDDLTTLEIINLLLIVISSYDLQAHVPSDKPVHNKYIKKENLISQKNFGLINKWTKSKKMMLNMKKTKIMIINFTKNKQFTKLLQENNMNIEVVTKFKLLGTWITNYLKWDVNVQYLVKRAYGRLQLLNKAASYTRNKGDLKSIYKTHIRFILEQSSCVWNSSFSAENIADMRRVQKAAMRIIMGQD